MKAGKWVLVVVMLLVGCGREEESPTPTNLPQPQVTVITTTSEPTSTIVATAVGEDDVKPPATPTPMPTIPVLTATPMPTATPAFSINLSESAVAQRIGTGDFKVIFVADNHLAVDVLYRHFEQSSQQLSEDVSAWFVGNANPRQLPDFLLGADSGFDGCPRDQGGNNPFDSAESRTLRTFTNDATLVLFVYTGNQNRIILDSCEQSVSNRQLAEQLREATGFPIGRHGGASGHWVDYWSGEDVTTVAIELEPDTQLSPDTLTFLTDETTFVETISPDTNFEWLTDKNAWHLTPDSLHHPLAITNLHGIYYLIDSGRVLAIDPEVENGTLISILNPGDLIGGVRVLEPLDIANNGEAIFVLDRAGDVYKFEQGSWSLDRYDRPIRDRSAHYFVALDTQADNRFLLETTAPLILRYDGEERRTALDGDSYMVDLDVIGTDLYVLAQKQEGAEGTLDLLREGVRVSAFRPTIAIRQPRQVHAADESVLVLDHDGRRVVMLDRLSGKVVRVYHFADRSKISSVWHDGTQLVFAGKDTLTFVNGSQPSRMIATHHLLTNNFANDFGRLQQLDDFVIPIGIPQFIQRDYQLAGAPRHYRLGVHEGIDFYWQRGTQISAIGSGTVVRADWEYVEPYPALFDLWRNEAYEMGYTSEDSADFFRGRQIWIDHGNNIIARYVHLASIDPAVQVGAVVEQGQIIARVGNSGSPASLEGENEDTHLHIEIRIGEGYFGQFLRPIETRHWLYRILH